MRATCLTFLLCLLVLGLGCTSTEGPEEPELPVPTELSGTIGAGGGTLTSSDGLLSITIPAGALDSNTDIILREIDPSEADTAFDGAQIYAVLQLEPAGLTFNNPAQVTFRFSTVPGAAAMSKVPSDPAEPPESDFVLAVVKAPEGAEVPDQKTHYNMNPGAANNAETTVDFYTADQIAYANTLHGLGGFGYFAALLGPDPIPDPYVGRRIGMEVQLTMPDETAIEFGETIFENDPVAVDITPNMSEGEIWNPTETTPIDNNRIMLVFYFEVVPEQEGQTVFGACLGGTIVLVEPDLTGLNFGPDPVFGDLDFTIEMPVLEQTVETTSQTDLSIATGMTGLKDLAVVFGSSLDPAPLGDPGLSWLYIAGAEGVQYYRLNEAGGAITSSELLYTLSDLNQEGVAPISTGSTPDIARALFMWSSSSGSITNWVPANGWYGMTGVIITTEVYDAVGYGGTAHTEGISIARGIGAYFLEYNSSLNMYTWPESPDGPLMGNLFPGDGGPIVSCFVHPATRGALVIKDGLPGEIWYHSRQDLEVEGTRLGTTGNEPEQIRGAGGFYAISNYTSNSLTTFTWYGSASISNVSTTPVGLGPEGIDVLMLPDVTLLVVSTALDGHYTLSRFSAGGGHLKSVTYDVPSTCTGPRYAVFVQRGPLVYVALSCHDSGTVELIAVDLQDLQ